MHCSSALKSEIFEKLLPYVAKPGQYTGNEINVIRKDARNVRVRLALAFPDFYQVGMSYMGFQVLYHVANRRSDFYAERVYAPMADMEERMRALGVPLFSLETHSPLADFDVVGFTLQYELHYTTVLNMLELAEIPLQAKERTELPLVIAGGPSAFNPEPMADFFDAVVIGDGETLLLEICDRVGRAKETGQSRQELLLELAGVPGIYVPRFYRPIFSGDGSFQSVETTQAGCRMPIRARIEQTLPLENYSLRPLVPLIGT
ncbi:B12-binding domain-containing radical SAM protein, partial [candidate division KSB1 bacterium]|nr:B12-binding domain-containing radical SAM protein [candidate division KSB1 bacterium]